MPSVGASTIRQRVRGLAIWAGVGAALLLYFGYAYGFVYPADDRAAQVGALLLAGALKGGGWAMAGATLWLATGRRAALIGDAVVTALVGLLFAVGGALWLVSGVNLQGVLFVVFGAIFVQSARGSWREYGLLGDWPDIGAPAATSASAEPADCFPEPPEALASQLMARVGQEADLPDATPPAAPTPADADEEPAPEGYLARFGPQDRPPGTA